MDLSIYTQNELEKMRDKLNLTDDELKIFEMLAKKKSRTEIASKIQLSTRSVDRRIKCIKEKLNRL